MNRKLINLADLFKKLSPNSARAALTKNSRKARGA
jgi:hypothetical protein